MPSGPNTAAARSSLVMTQTCTIRLARATSAADPAGRTPCAAARAILSATMSYPVTRWPVATSRLVKAWPIRPRPMNPRSGLPCAMVRRSLSRARDRPRSQVISAGGRIAKARSAADRPAALQSLSRDGAAGLPGPGSAKAGTTRLLAPPCGSPAPQNGRRRAIPVRILPVRIGPPPQPWPIWQKNLDTTGTGRCDGPCRRGSDRQSLAPRRGLGRRPAGPDQTAAARAAK